MNEQNPYAPPLVESLAKPDPESTLPADIRMLHRTHEASLRQVGLYYLLTSSVGVIFAIPVTLRFIADGVPGAFIMMVLLGLLALGIFVGLGLRQLQRKSFIPATISAVIWMLLFPVGTVVNICLLYLLYSKKGRRILADDYQEIIAATPELNYSRDWEVWCVFGCGSSC